MDLGYIAEIEEPVAKEAPAETAPKKSKEEIEAEKERQKLEQKKAREDQELAGKIQEVASKLDPSAESLYRISDHFAGVSSLRNVEREGVEVSVNLAGASFGPALVHFLLIHLELEMNREVQETFLTDAAQWMTDHKKVDSMDAVERTLAGNPDALRNLDRFWTILNRLPPPKERPESREILTQGTRDKAQVLKPTGLLMSGIQYMTREDYQFIREKGLQPYNKRPIKESSSLKSLFPDKISLALSESDAFRNSAILAFGPVHSRQHVTFVIDPDYVRQHAHLFELVGSHLGDEKYRLGLKNLGLVKSVQVIETAYWDEIHVGELPVEAIVGILVRPEKVEEILAWDAQLGFQNLPIYLMDKDRSDLRELVPYERPKTETGRSEAREEGPPKGEAIGRREGSILTPAGLLVTGIQSISFENYRLIREQGLLSFHERLNWDERLNKAILPSDTQTRLWQLNWGRIGPLDRVSLSLSPDIVFSTSGINEYGPRMDKRHIAVLIDPAYVRQHPQDFELLGHNLKSPNYTEGLRILGLDQNELNVKSAAYHDEIHVSGLPPEAIAGFLVHPEKLAEILDWDRKLGRDSLPIYLVDQDVSRQDRLLPWQGERPEAREGGESTDKLAARDSALVTSPQSLGLDFSAIMEQEATQEVRKVWEGPRARALPLRWEQYGTRFLVHVLSEWLGETVYAESAGILPPAPKASILRQALGEGRLIPQPSYTEALEKLSSTPAHVLLDSIWLEKLIEESPRALYILLSAVEKLQEKEGMGQIQVGFLGDETLYAQIEEAFRQRQDRFGDNGLNWEEQLEAQNFLVPKLRGFVKAVSPYEIADYVRAEQYGVATLVSGQWTLPESIAGANFELNPETVHADDLMTVAMMPLNLFKAAQIVYGITDSAERIRKLKEHLDELFPGANQKGAGFELELAEYIEAILVTNRLIDVSA